VVKKVYFYILVFFSFFAFSVIIFNIWLYKKESQVVISVTSTYQYKMIINEVLYNKIYLIKNILDKYYKEIIKNEMKKKVELVNNDLYKLITILKTLQNLDFKNYKSFLFKYILNIYNEDIEIIQNNKIMVSKKLERIGKDFNYPCNPFKNYGQCSIVKNNKFTIVKYSPAYKLIIVSSFRLNNFNTKSVAEKLITVLKTIPDIIIYYNGIKLKGEFYTDQFYIFDKFKPLNIFFGFGIKYQKIDSLSSLVNKKVIQAVKPILYTFAIIYFIIISLMYSIIFTIFRKNIKNIDNTIKDFNQKAVTDKLTGIYNRLGFENEINNKKCKYFLIIDLDNFKYINDTFGHEIGDKILKEFTKLLKKYFKNDILGRWGGDEFLICTNKNKSEIQDILEIVNLHLKEIQKTYDKNLTKNLSASAGGCGNNMLDLQKRFNNADLALYKVKKTKKGKVLFYRDINYIKIEKEDINK